MADAADIAFELVDAAVPRGLATIAADIPAGVEGECDECGEAMPRLVGGRCGFCRDGRKPPLSFYADRAAAPAVPGSTTKEELPMAPPTPAALGRKIMIEGEALKAVERRADADQTSWKQAADELILLGLGVSSGVSAPAPIAEPADWDGSKESAMAIIVNVPNAWLVDEIARRFDDGVGNEDYHAAVTRAETAEARLARVQAAMAGDA